MTERVRPSRRAPGAAWPVLRSPAMSADATLLPRTAPPHEVLRAVLEALDRGHRVVLASVVARHGSAPATPGQKLVLLDERTAVGTIGGGAVERVVLDRMLAALADP